MDDPLAIKQKRDAIWPPWKSNSTKQQPISFPCFSSTESILKLRPFEFLASSDKIFWKSFSFACFKKIQQKGQNSFACKVSVFCFTLSSLINEHAQCSLILLKKKIHPTCSHLRAFYRQAAPNFAYSFIKFEEKFQPTRLFQPTCLLGSWVVRFSVQFCTQ
jgi:hypothetical protein